MQQHQLRLYRHIETPSNLEQTNHQVAKRDLTDRPGKDRFADRAYSGLEFFRAGGGRHPARAQVSHGDCPIITVKKSKQVLSKIAFIGFGERAHDAKIDCPILALRADKNITRMHIGMKEAITKGLSKKDLNAVMGQLAQIYASGPDRIDIAYRNTLDTLHHQNLATAVVPIDLGHVDHI